MESALHVALQTTLLFLHSARFFSLSINRKRCSDRRSGPRILGYADKRLHSLPRAPNLYFSLEASEHHFPPINVLHRGHRSWFLFVSTAMQIHRRRSVPRT